VNTGIVLSNRPQPSPSKSLPYSSFAVIFWSYSVLSV